MHIYVRRGGPNYQRVLARMRALGEEIGIPIEVYGPEADKDHVRFLMKYASCIETTKQPIINQITEQQDCNIVPKFHRNLTVKDLQRLLHLIQGRKSVLGMFTITAAARGRIISEKAASP